MLDTARILRTNGEPPHHILPPIRPSDRGLGLLHDTLAAGIIHPEDWEGLSLAVQDELRHCSDPQLLLQRLVEHRLLTEYQATRLGAGKAFGLMLGNYRVLQRIGSGGMGIVFKGEHVAMRTTVAIKVLPLTRDQSCRDLQRFYGEARAIAQLQHLNIVRATDAGKTIDPDPDQPVLHYYVMEYVPGIDLEDLVRNEGPLNVSRACDLMYQIASALTAADKHGLVHRDIKPPNVMVTPEGQAKLLDFGLVHNFRHRVTEPGTVLGTVDYIAPEQARDASRVDIRADIYSLGATLYWALTGRIPFASCGNVLTDLIARQTQPPPSIRAVCPELPVELDAVVARMLACDPDDRYLKPQAVMTALIPFLKPESCEYHLHPLAQADLRRGAGRGAPVKLEGRVHRVLIVDDVPSLRTLVRRGLEQTGIHCEEACDGPQALGLVRAKPFDLVLLDMVMPGGLTGLDVSQRLREKPPTPNLKIILYSGQVPGDDLAQLMLTSADDFLVKPASMVQLTNRIKAALRHKDAQDRADQLNQRLLVMNSQLEQSLSARDSDVLHIRGAMVLALANIVERREQGEGSRLHRLQRYCRLLAETAAGVPIFAGRIDGHFIEMLECCAPLHDIGKVALPDHILMKPGRLDSEERLIMQSHTVIGAETLKQVAARHGGSLGFIQMAIDIARHHHERYDGKGYPDRLSGEAIPLAARIVALGDVYDALRSRRPHRPALSHAAATQLMSESAGAQFDPALLQVFLQCAPEMERVHRELRD